MRRPFVKTCNQIACNLIAAPYGFGVAASAAAAFTTP